MEVTNPVIRKLEELEAYERAGREAKQRIYEAFAELALRQAEVNLRVMCNRHAAQMAPLTDLLDAQSQWQQAASNRIEAATQYQIYRTEYLRATGRLE